jgi:hypothetical protein
MWFSLEQWSASDFGIWASVFAQLGLLGTVIVAIRQLRADHMRSRRERTLEIMQFWTKNMVTYAREVYAVRQIISNLEKRQCEDLWRAGEMRIAKKYQTQVLNALKMTPEELKFENSYILLPSTSTLRIREITAFYLNLLETVFFAWRNSVGDRAMIKDEFGPLLAPPGGGYPLEEITCASGVYPSIRQYIFEQQREDRCQRFSEPIA